MTINLVLADPHPLMLWGLEQLFAVEPGFAVLAYCTNGEQATSAVHLHKPDILLMDLRLPDKNGLTVLRELRAKTAHTARVVLFAAAFEERELLEAIRLGVRGAILKETAPELLLECLREVYAGGEWLAHLGLSDLKHSQETEKPDILRRLTSREIELVQQVAVGLGNRDIAANLRIAEGTVKVHLHRIYEKLEVKGRVGLTLRARDSGLV